jgi:hypothetical protein
MRRAELQTVFKKENKQQKEQRMKNHEVEFRIESLQREAQTNALLKEVRMAESAALRNALREILGIFKHWTFGLPKSTATHA